MAARFTEAEACTPTPVEEGGLPAHALDEAMAKLGDFWDTCIFKVFAMFSSIRTEALLPSRYLVIKSCDYHP